MLLSWRGFHITLCRCPDMFGGQLMRWWGIPWGMRVHLLCEFFIDKVCEGRDNWLCFLEEKKVYLPDWEDGVSLYQSGLVFQSLGCFPSIVLVYWSSARILKDGKLMTGYCFYICTTQRSCRIILLPYPVARQGRPHHLEVFGWSEDERVKMGWIFLWCNWICVRWWFVWVYQYPDHVSCLNHEVVGLQPQTAGTPVLDSRCLALIIYAQRRGIHAKYKRRYHTQTTLQQIRIQETMREG